MPCAALPQRASQVDYSTRARSEREREPKPGRTLLSCSSCVPASECSCCASPLFSARLRDGSDGEHTLYRRVQSSLLLRNENALRVNMSATGHQHTLEGTSRPTVQPSAADRLVLWPAVALDRTLQLIPSPERSLRDARAVREERRSKQGVSRAPNSSRISDVRDRGKRSRAQNNNALNTQ